MTLTDPVRHAVPTMVESGRGGWRLHVVCVVCGHEALFKAVLLPLAADLAERDGWALDRDALHVSAHERYATCPRHTKPSQ